MKYNYPIKYTSMPIKSSDGLLIGHIVSKCYVIYEVFENSLNGIVEKYYEVLFPFNVNEKEVERVKVLSSSNKETVFKVFDDFKSAKEYVEQMNKDLFSKAIICANFDILNIISQSFDFHLIEKKINEESDDLVVGRVSKEQRVILEDEQILLITDYSLYDVLSNFKKVPYRVFNISQEDFNRIKSKESNDLDLSDARLFIRNNPKNNQTLIYDYEDSKEVKFYFQNEQLVRTSTDSTIENPSSEKKFYTMESLEDLVESYIATLANPEDTDVLFNGKKYFIKKNK